MLQTAETRATAPETAHDVNPTGEWMRCGHPHWTEGHRTSDCIRNKYWYDEGVIVERRRGWRERRLVQGITGNVLRAASVGRAEEGRRWRMPRCMPAHGQLRIRPEGWGNGARGPRR